MVGVCDLLFLCTRCSYDICGLILLANVIFSISITWIESLNVLFQCSLYYITIKIECRLCSRYHSLTITLPFYRSSRSQSCPFCRDNLKKTCPGDLWIYVEDQDVVDMETVSSENLRRLFMYISKLPLIVPDVIFNVYDSHIKWLWRLLSEDLQPVLSAQFQLILCPHAPMFFHFHALLKLLEVPELIWNRKPSCWCFRNLFSACMHPWSYAATLYISDLAQLIENSVLAPNGGRAVCVYLMFPLVITEATQSSGHWKVSAAKLGC